MPNWYSAAPRSKFIGDWDHAQDLRDLPSSGDCTELPERERIDELRWFRREAVSLSSDDRCYVVRNDEAGDIVQVSSPNDSELEVAMITPDQFRTLVASRSIDARIDAHGTIQIPLEELDRFLELTEELGLVILGLDGLRQDGAVIVPLIDYIADFSDVAGPWLDRVRASAAAARAVAADWVGGPDLVEMVLDGLDE